jgi:transposase InsO family protein
MQLCSTMRADDVTDTLEPALAASGCDSVKVVHKPRLLSDNGSSYISSDLAEWLKDRGIAHVRGAMCHPQTQGKIERWHQTLKNCSRTIVCPVISKPRLRVLRQRPDHPSRTSKDQTRHHQTATIATSVESRLISNPNEPEPPFQTPQIVPNHLKTDRF